MSQTPDFSVPVVPANAVVDLGAAVRATGFVEPRSLGEITAGLDGIKLEISVLPHVMEHGGVFQKRVDSPYKDSIERFGAEIDAIVARASEKLDAIPAKVAADYSARIAEITTGTTGPT